MLIWASHRTQICSWPISQASVPMWTHNQQLRLAFMCLRRYLCRTACRGYCKTQGVRPTPPVKLRTGLEALLNQSFPITANYLKHYNSELFREARWELQNKWDKALKSDQKHWVPSFRCFQHTSDGVPKQCGHFWKSSAGHGCAWPLLVQWVTWVQ